MVIAKSVFLFILAGLFEIGGGYLVWLWLREGKSAWVALAGAVVLILLTHASGIDEDLVLKMFPVRFVRVTVDEKAATAIIASGLPEYFAKRLKEAK